MTGSARLAWICGGFLFLVAAVALGSLLVGAAPVPAGAVFDLITGRGPAEGTGRTVVLAIRLPRIAAALLAGGALAVAGAGFQALTRNPLAEPSILGVSGGAAFGVVLGQVSGLGQGIVETLGLTALGFAGALVAGGVLYLIASGKAGFDPTAGFASNGYGTHSPGGFSLPAALVTEVVMTMMFLFIIMGATLPQGASNTYYGQWPERILRQTQANRPVHCP